MKTTHRQITVFLVNLEKFILLLSSVQLYKRLIAVEEYYLMAEVGILQEKRTELIQCMLRQGLSNTGLQICKQTR